MSTHGSYQRVLIHLQKALKSLPTPFKFTESLVNILSNGTGDKDLTMVYVKQLNNEGKIVLSNEPLSSNDSPVKLKRPSFCPISNTTDEHLSQLPRDTKSRGVDTGAVALVESCDGHVLLIRRAKHLRTFPGVWVPPGGHVEMGEKLEDAGLRELKEEVGLDVTENMVEYKRILALWESVFPPILSMGDPKRHHVVVYMHFKLRQPYTSEKMFEKLKPDPEETEACAWLNRDLVKAIVAAAEGTSHTVDLSHITKPTFKALLTPQNGSTQVSEISTDVLVNRATGEKEDIERVSTGTKYALSEWLLATR